MSGTPGHTACAVFTFKDQESKEKFIEFSKDWKYPLNMIDFETSTVALPYFKGMRPYETVAFQFSHHIMHEDGNVEHFNDYISWEPNTYPNIEFVKELKPKVFVWIHTDGLVGIRIVLPRP